VNVLIPHNSDEL